MKRIDFKDDNNSKHLVYARHYLKCNAYINLFNLTTTLQGKYFYYDDHFTEREIGTQSGYETCPE